MGYLDEDVLYNIVEEKYKIAKGEARAAYSDVLDTICETPRANIAPKTEWVSVEEKNPEDVYGKDREKITVLVCTKSGKVSASTRCARYSYDYGQNTWVRTGEYEWSGGKKVTHWQPMPDPPHQQDDRQERIET